MFTTARSSAARARLGTSDEPRPRLETPRRLRLRRLPRRRSRCPRRTRSTTRRSTSSLTRDAARDGPQDAAGGHAVRPERREGATRADADETVGHVALPPRRRHRRALPRPGRRPRTTRSTSSRTHVEDWPGAQIRDAHLDAAPRPAPHPPDARPDPRRGAARSSTTASSSTGGELFPREVELHFADAYDKLLRATEGLEISRDLLARRPRLLPGEDRERPERGR